MTDNNQLWEDTEPEYSEDEEELENDYSEDESSDEYEDDESSDEYEDDDDYEYEDESDSKGLPKVLIAAVIILLFLLAGTAGYFFLKKSDSSGSNSAGSPIDASTAADIQSEDDLFFGDNSDNNMTDVSFDSDGKMNVTEQNGDDIVSVNENSEIDADGSLIASSGSLNDSASGSDSAFKVSDADESFIDKALSDSSQENSSITVSYNKTANKNPFKPPVLQASDRIGLSPYALVDNVRFEIIEPPVSSVPDENLTRLLSTQISGIMYDEESPSAIVNLNKQDYFVKKGDVISGYTIKNITKDQVQINYKNNSYIASVGQLFTRGTLDKPAVANIESKFAGRNKYNN